MPSERILRACVLLTVMTAVGVLAGLCGHARGLSSSGQLPASYRASGAR